MQLWWILAEEGLHVLLVLLTLLLSFLFVQFSVLEQKKLKCILYIYWHKYLEILGASPL